MRRFLWVCMLWLTAAAIGFAAEPSWPDNIDARLQALSNAHAERLGVAAMVIEDGRIVGSRLQGRFAMGGAVALPLAMTVLDAVDRGRVRMDGALRTSLRAALSEGSREAMSGLLARAGGVAAVRDYLAGIGVVGIHIHSDHGVPRGCTTPLALLTLLDRVHQHGALGDNNRALLVRLLGHAVPAGSVTTAAAAEHTWWLRAGAARTRTAAGIVVLPNGRHLALVVSAEAARADVREAMVGEVTRRVWHWQVPDPWHAGSVRVASTP